MNDVYEALSGFLEDLRCDSGEREYSVRTEEMKSADEELKRRTPKYEDYLDRIPAKDKQFLVRYMEVVDHAHFHEEQRAYYQGIVDTIQMMEGLGLVEKSNKMKKIVEKMKK
ncbi:MAG: hypothetical protein Q4B70_05900 [Lachnospiraceae bacterium]|nr:hypothetical protein [Lachnospiraceae bacterium]